MALNKVVATTPVKAKARTTADFNAIAKKAAKKAKGNTKPAPIPRAA